MKKLIVPVLAHISHSLIHGLNLYKITFLALTFIASFTLIMPLSTAWANSGTIVSPRRDNIYEVSETDSVIVYFYTPWCPFCYEIAPIMDNLPDYVIINGQRSTVRLISYNRDIPQHHAIIRAYHEMMGVPEDRRFIPLVIIGDRNLFLYDEVSNGLLAALEAGEGLTTPLFTLIDLRRTESGSSEILPGLPLVLIWALTGMIVITLCLVIIQRKVSNVRQTAANSGKGSNKREIQ